MSDFREKLVAMGRGQASLDDVLESLDTLVTQSPAKAPQARELLDSAKRGGLSDSIHAKLVARIESSLAAASQGDTTVMTPRRGGEEQLRGLPAATAETAPPNQGCQPEVADGGKAARIDHKG